MCSSITDIGFLVSMRSPHRRAAPPKAPAAGQGILPRGHSATPLCRHSTLSSAALSPRSSVRTRGSGIGAHTSSAAQNLFTDA